MSGKTISELRTGQRVVDELLFQIENEEIGERFEQVSKVFQERHAHSVLFGEEPVIDLILEIEVWWAPEIRFAFGKACFFVSPLGSRGGEERVAQRKVFEDVFAKTDVLHGASPVEVQGLGEACRWAVMWSDEALNVAANRAQEAYRFLRREMTNA